MNRDLLTVFFRLTKGIIGIMVRNRKEKKGGRKKAPTTAKNRTLLRIKEEELPKVSMEPLPAPCCMSCGCSRPKEEYPPEAIRVMDVSILIIIIILLVSYYYRLNVAIIGTLKGIYRRFYGLFTTTFGCFEL